MAIIWYEPSVVNNVIENNENECVKTKTKEIKEEIVEYIKKQARKELYTTRSFVGVSPEYGLSLMIGWGLFFIIPSVIKDVKAESIKNQEKKDKAEKEYLKTKLEDEKLKLEELKLMKEYAELQKSFIVNENQDVEGLF